MYELHIELLGITPIIWRNILVPDDTKLSKLHRIIQAAVGWTNTREHEFTFNRRYGKRAANDVLHDRSYDERGITLDAAWAQDTSLNARRTSFIYAYDFIGAPVWSHVVSIENIIVANEPNDWPVCIAGENACPPEDVGGVDGYQEFVRIITEPHHADYAATYRRYGGPFDPKGFDLNSANARIRRLR
jgi:hypothetical protein